MNINNQISQLNLREVKEAWGGRIPSWEEFKEAKKSGKIRVDQVLASRVFNVNSKGIPKPWFIIYGLIVPWLMFLSIPLSIAFTYFLNLNWWSVAGGIFLSWFLFKVASQGHCDAILDGAEQNKELYEFLIQNGAFIFHPLEKRNIS